MSGKSIWASTSVMLGAGLAPCGVQWLVEILHKVRRLTLYSAGEREVYDYSHAQGLDAALVRDVMRDDVEAREFADGPMPDEALDAMEKKYQVRGVPKEVTAEYRRWARERGYV
jgi:hypothetical protein